MSKSVLATTNAEPVAHAVGLLKSLGAIVATAEDAQYSGLPEACPQSPSESGP